MKKTNLILIILVSLLVVIFILLMIQYPLRKSAEKIQKDILEITPIGTKMETVINIINENRWLISHISNDVGYEMHPIDSPNGKIYIVGTKHIRALIGEYPSPFITSVSVFWGFDEKTNLVGVYVIKETDGF